jgi:hypothetical protein
MTVKHGAARIVFAAVVLAVMTFGGCSNPANDDDPKGPGTPEIPDEVVAQNITAAEVNACPAIGGFKDIDALIENKLAGDANDTFTFPADVQVAVSASNIGRARITIPASIIKGVKNCPQADLGKVPNGAWVNPASQFVLDVPQYTSNITIRNSKADSANKQVVPFIIRDNTIAKQYQQSDGTYVTWKLDKSIVAIFKDGTVADNTAAQARLNALHIILADNQANDSYQPINCYPLMWVNNTVSDIQKIYNDLVGASNFTTPLPLPDGRTLEVNGTVTGTETAMLNKRPEYFLASVLGNIKVSQATYVAAVAAQKQGLYS